MSEETVNSVAPAGRDRAARRRMSQDPTPAEEAMGPWSARDRRRRPSSKRPPLLRCRKRSACSRRGDGSAGRLRRCCRGARGAARRRCPELRRQTRSDARPPQGARRAVVSNKMEKTVVVAVESRVRHPLYGKFMRRTTKFKAHDETEPAAKAIPSRSWRRARSPKRSAGASCVSSRRRSREMIQTLYPFEVRR